MTHTAAPCEDPLPDGAPAPSIAAENLHIALAGNEIVADISLTVRDGEYLSIVGPNGAGKSTLLRCIAGLCAPTSGRVCIQGKELSRFRRRHLARIVSYVPQVEQRAMPFTVHEFVMMGRYPHLSPFSSCRPEDEEVVDKALRQTGTSAFRHRLVDTLSGGERQNVFIAAALAQEGRILLLDEPATFLDYRHQSDVMSIIREVNRRDGKTVVAVNHDVNSALAASHRVLALKEGRIAFLGSPEEILEGNALRDVFDVDFRLVPDPAAKHPRVVVDEKP